MPSSIRPNGSFRPIDACSVRTGGSWRTVNNIYGKIAGTWELLWAAYTAIAVSISPAVYFNTVANNTGPYNVGFTANVTGGDGTETYTWVLTNTIGTGWSISSGQGTDNIQLTCADGSDETMTATLEVTVDDGTTTDTDSITITITYGTPP